MNKFPIFALIALALSLTGCKSAQVTSNIQTALVVDDKLQVVFNNLAIAAAVSIPLLPPEQQATARQTLADIQVRADAGFQTKEDALQAALVASQPSVDIAALSQTIMTVVEDLWGLCNMLGVSPRLLTRTRVTLDGYKAAIARGEYRSP